MPREHLRPGYAATEHGNQAYTVDVAHRARLHRHHPPRPLRRRHHGSRRKPHPRHDRHRRRRRSRRRCFPPSVSVWRRGTAGLAWFRSASPADSRVDRRRARCGATLGCRDAAIDRDGCRPVARAGAGASREPCSGAQRRRGVRAIRDIRAQRGAVPPRQRLVGVGSTGEQPAAVAAARGRGGVGVRRRGRRRR